MELARLAAERLPELPVGPAFLELADPPIKSAIDELLATSPVKRLLVLPLLLFAAGHAKRDIPNAVAAAMARHPEVECRQLPHLGTHRAVAELSARRMKEALAGAPDLEPGATLGLMVGRGSYDPEAQAEWRAFVARRQELTPEIGLESCFLAMASPTPEELLPVLLGGGWRRFVWQPHLLFQGELSDRVKAFANRLASEEPGRDWRATAHLGPEPSLAEAIAEIARNA